MTAVVWLASATVWSVTAGEPFSVESEAGLYEVLLTPAVDVLTVGEMHAWTMVLLDADGGAVSGATVLIDGGMPAHGHGLPTAPKVSEEPAAGAYRIDGLRFNMPGDWELRLSIDAASGADVAVLQFAM